MARMLYKVAGMYHLFGVKETSSGFKLNPDGTFLFFFTYGALDRYGSGYWGLKDDHVIFQSKPWAGRDFALTDSRSSGRADRVTIKMVDTNPVLVKHMFFSLKNGETGSWLQTGPSGELAFPAQPISTISAVFEFCPERFSHFNIENPEHNYFEFRLEPWIMEVFFDGFALKAERYALTGRHPLMRDAQYVYEKS